MKDINDKINDKQHPQSSYCTITTTVWLLYLIVLALAIWDYGSMPSNSAHLPKWMEKEMQEGNTGAKRLCMISLHQCISLHKEWRGLY